MAKVILKEGVQQMWGRIGDLVFRWSHTGEAQLSTVPDMSRVKWSAAQQAHRQRFKAAVAYARAAMADAQVRTRYEQAAVTKGKRPFDLAVSDYFKGRDLRKELRDGVISNDTSSEKTLG